MTLTVASKPAKEAKQGVPLEKQRASPKEHPRKGHFHRWKTKEGFVTHWLNPVIVNPGIGAKSHKSFFLKYEDEA